MKKLIIIALVLLGVTAQAQNQVGRATRAQLEAMWPVPYDTWLITYAPTDSVNIFIRRTGDNTTPASWRVIVGRNGIRYHRNTTPNTFNSANYFTQSQTRSLLLNRPKIASGLQNNYLPVWRSSDSTLVQSNVFNNTSSSRVGINTASPSATLHVNGDILAQNVNTNFNVSTRNLLTYGYARIDGSNTAAGTDRKLIFGFGSFIDNYEISVPSSTDYIMNRLHPSGTTTPFRVYWANGDVGMQVVGGVPRHRFNVDGTANISNALSVGSATTNGKVNFMGQGFSIPRGSVGVAADNLGVEIIAASDAQLQIGENSTFRIFNSSALQQELFRINPDTQIQLPSYTSAARFTGTLTGMLGFDASGNVLTTSPAGLLSASNTWTAANTFQQGVNLATSSGNVGIGTTTPASRLHVSGGGVRINTPASQALRMIRGVDTDYGFELSSGNIGFYNYLTSSYAYWINSLGNIGIGTMTPTSKLDVVDGAISIRGTTEGVRIFKNGSNSFESFLYLANQANNRVYNFQQNSDGSSLNLWTFDGSSWNNRTSFRTNGNVGIGTASPAGMLDVVSTTGGVVFPRMTTTQRDAISGLVNGTVIYNTTTDKLQVRAAGAWVDLH